MPEISTHHQAINPRRLPKWDVEQGPANYVTLVATQLLSSGLALGTVWMATRELGSSGYGSVVAIMAASQLLSHVAVNWTALSLFRHGCEEFVQTGRIAHAFWTRLYLLALSILALAVTGSLWWSTVSTWLKLPPLAIWLVAAHLVTIALWMHVQQSLQAAKLPRWNGSLLAAERATVLLVVLFVAVRGNASILLVASAYIVGPLVASLVGIWRIWTLVFPPDTWDRALLKRMLTFSAPLIPFAILAFLSTNFLDAFFISHFLSLSDLGVFQLAYQMAGSFSMLPILAGSLLLPLFVTLDADSAGDRMSLYFRNVLPMLTLAWSLAAASFAFVSAMIVNWFFGEEFHSASSLVWPLCAGFAINGPVPMGYAVLANARSLTYLSTVTSAVMATSNLILNLLWIPRFGLVGCAWATACSYGLATLAWTLLSHRAQPASRSWAALAAAPALAGTIYMAWRHQPSEALLTAVTVAILILLLGRRSLASTRELFAAAGYFQISKGSVTVARSAVVPDNKTLL